MTQWPTWKIKLFYYVTIIPLSIWNNFTVLFWNHALFGKLYINPFNFYLCYFFPREFQRAFVWTQIQVESNGGASNLAKNYNNLFGMGYPQSVFATGSYNSGRKGEPVFATYKSTIWSLFDYYYYITSYKPALGKALYKNYKTGSSVGSLEWYNYLSWVVGVYGGNRYFMAPVESYFRAMSDRSKKWHDYYITGYAWATMWIFVFYISLLCLLFALLRFLVRSKKPKSKRSK